MPVELPEETTRLMNDSVAMEKEYGKDSALTTERWLLTIFKKIAGDWVRTVDAVQLRGSVELPGGAEGMKKLFKSDVKFDDYKMPVVAKDDPTPVKFRMPERMLGNLEKGLAIQARWNEVMKQPDVKWHTSKEWLTEVVTESVLSLHADNERKAMDREAEEIYSAKEKKT